MASENTSVNVPQDDPAGKGKGKDVVESHAEDTAMDEDDSSSSSDEGEEEVSRHSFTPRRALAQLRLRAPSPTSPVD